MEKLEAAGLGIQVLQGLMFMGIPLAYAITYTLAFTDTMGNADITRCLVKDGATEPMNYDPAGNIENLFKTDNTAWQKAFNNVADHQGISDVSTLWKQEMLFGLIVNWLFFAVTGLILAGQIM